MPYVNPRKGRTNKSQHSRKYWKRHSFGYRPTIERLEDRMLLAFTMTGVPSWTEQGPGPLQFGQVGGMGTNPVVGSVQALAAHPTNADILFAGGSNGGVWRTTNATAAGPNWTPLTDSFPSLSIGGMAFNPANSNELIVAIGNRASGGFDALGAAGGDLTGALYTTDALAATPTWRMLTDSIQGSSNIAAAARNGYLLVAGSGGLFRSTDGGNNFDPLSGSGNLPNGLVYELFGDAGNANRFYAAGNFGIFRTDDASAANPNWINVTAAQMLIGASTTNIRMGVHNSVGNNVVYAGVVNNGQLASVTWSTNQGGAWNTMDVPGVIIGGNPIGIQPREKPGTQGGIHFSLVVSPTDPNLVFVGGDRQQGPFPTPTGNPIGAIDFTGNLFRGDRSVGQGAGTAPLVSAQWTPINDNFAGGNGTPHADSRRMVFDANGNIIEADDGGVYRRAAPATNTGAWTSVNGNLRVAEFWTISRDTVNNIIFGGFQDTGTGEQTGTNNTTWNEITLGDGFFTGVDNTSVANTSFRYTMGNTFSNFVRRGFNNTNTPLNRFQGQVTNASNAGPIVITTPQHALVTGDRVLISGVTGNTAANGFFTVTVINGTQFSLNGSNGNAAYSGGGSWTRFGPIGNVSGAAGTPVIITSNGHRLNTGDQVSFQQLAGNAALNGNSFTVTVINANQYSVDGTAADGSNTNAGFWNRTENVLLKTALGAANRSGLNAADQAAGAALNAFALNAVDPRLMMIGATGLYEDNNTGGNAGDVIANVTPAAMTGFVRAIAYGGRRDGTNFSQIAWVGTQNGQLFVRGEAGGFVQRFTGGAGQVTDIVLDPDDWRIGYVLQGNGVFMTTNGGQSFTPVTDNLGSLSTQIRTISLWDPTPGSTAGDEVLVAGGRGGVFRRLQNPYCPENTWSEYGAGLPNTHVQDLQIFGNTLLAGTYGRGAWEITNVSATIGVGAELLVTGDGNANAIELRTDLNNSALLIAADGIGNTQSFEKGLFQRIAFQGLGGADTIRIDSNGTAAGGTVDFVTFLLDVNGGGDLGDILIFEDSSDITADRVTVTENSVGAIPASVDYLGDNFFGECGEAIYAGLSQLTVNLSSGDDTAFIRATSIATIINGNDGADSFNVGNLLNSLDDILGALTINGNDPTASDVLLINDQDDTDPHSYVVTSATVERDGAATITYGTIESLTVNAGGGGNSINVQSTAAGTAVIINAGAADDNIAVDSNGGPLDPPDGTVNLVVSGLTINGQGGANTLRLEDFGDPNLDTGDVVHVTPTQIGADPTDNFFGTGGSLTYSELAHVTLNLSNGYFPDTVYLIPSPTTAFELHGNDPDCPMNPDQLPGDALYVDFTGVTDPLLVADGEGHATWTFSNREDVAFDGFEKLNHVGIIVVAPDQGSASLVRVFDAETGVEKFSFYAFGQQFRGGVRVAVADLNCDGIPDIIAGAGPGGAPEVRVINGVTGLPLVGTLGSFLAYSKGSKSGVWVATADINQDGHSDIITGPDNGGGKPTVKVFSGEDGSLYDEFDAYERRFHGGVRVAAGDINGDGVPDIVTSPGSGRAPEVRVFDGLHLTAGPISSFLAFSNNYKHGLYLAVGDINGDGRADIVAGGGDGGQRLVRIFDGTDLTQTIATFAPYANQGADSIRVAVTDIDGDGDLEIVASRGFGRSNVPEVFDVELTPELVDNFFGSDDFMKGLFVAASV